MKELGMKMSLGKRKSGGMVNFFVLFLIIRGYFNGQQILGIHFNSKNIKLFSPNQVHSALSWFQLDG